MLTSTGPKQCCFSVSVTWHPTKNAKWWLLRPTGKVNKWKSRPYMGPTMFVSGDIYNWGLLTKQLLKIWSARCPSC